MRAWIFLFYSPNKMMIILLCGTLTNNNYLFGTKSTKFNHSEAISTHVRFHKRPFSVKTEYSQCLVVTISEVLFLIAIS